MKKYILINFLSGFILTQPAENYEKTDSTFILLKSGDSVKINKLDASFTYQPMIKFDLKFSDFDSTDYDISEVSKMLNSQGKTSISKNTMLMIKFIYGFCNLSISLILFYFIIV